MKRYINEVRKLLLVIHRRKFKALGRELRQRLYSNTESYLLRRDLTVPFQAAAPWQPIEVRPLIERDIPVILNARPGRLSLLRADIPTCYVAVNAQGELCYMQWLIDADAQQRFRPFFKGKFIALRKDEVLLEFAYTFEQFRGQRIMGAAMAAIAERGLSRGARAAVTYVLRDNLAALKGCAQAGFAPSLIREERWRCFFFRQSFKALSAAYPAPATAPIVTQTGKSFAG